MIVCSCNAFSDHEVRSAVASAAGQPRMSKIYRCLGFKAPCGRCTYTIKQIMEEAPNRSVYGAGNPHQH
jgi:bacterioferritin-associated ferredoxin